jgi:hypothetical protein
MCWASILEPFVITVGKDPALMPMRCSIGIRCSTSDGWLLTLTATITWWSLSTATGQF